MLGSQLNAIVQKERTDKCLASLCHVKIFRLFELPTRLGSSDCGGVPAAEDYLMMLADSRHRGDVERTGQLILNDYRAGYLGQFALEMPRKS
jgi:hypothetical protein